MNIIIKICHKLDEVWTKATSKHKPSEEVEQLIETRRKNREETVACKMQEYEVKKLERQRLAEERKEQEKQEVLALLQYFVKLDQLEYTMYEFNEIKRNKAFFTAVEQRVFESGEQGLSFIACEFDKSSKREYKGYLFVTNKRVFFIDRRLQNFHKFRYQTIINVNWFSDGVLERGLYIQYGKRRLEFDEIFDMNQLKRVGNLILHLSKR